MSSYQSVVVGSPEPQRGPKRGAIFTKLCPQSLSRWGFSVIIRSVSKLEITGRGIEDWQSKNNASAQSDLILDGGFEEKEKRKRKSLHISRVNSLWIVAWVSDSYSNKVSLFMWPLKWQHTVYTFHCLTLWADRHVCYVLQLLVNIFWSWMLSLKQYHLSIPIYIDILVISPFISVYHVSIHICVLSLHSYLCEHDMLNWYLVIIKRDKCFSCT